MDAIKESRMTLNEGKNGEEPSGSARQSVVWCLGSDVKRRLREKRVAIATAVLLCEVMMAVGR